MNKDLFLSIKDRQFLKGEFVFGMQSKIQHKHLSFNLCWIKHIEKVSMHHTDERKELKNKK